MTFVYRKAALFSARNSFNCSTFCSLSSNIASLLTPTTATFPACFSAISDRSGAAFRQGSHLLYRNNRNKMICQGNPMLTINLSLNWTTDNNKDNEISTYQRAQKSKTTIVSTPSYFAPVTTSHRSNTDRTSTFCESSSLCHPSRKHSGGPSFKEFRIFS